jgi:hypothetical protein
MLLIGDRDALTLSSRDAVVRVVVVQCASEVVVVVRSGAPEVVVNRRWSWRLSLESWRWSFWCFGCRCSAPVMVLVVTTVVRLWLSWWLSLWCAGGGPGSCRCGVPGSDPGGCRCGAPGVVLVVLVAHRLIITRRRIEIFGTLNFRTTELSNEVLLPGETGADWRAPSAIL